MKVYIVKIVCILLLFSFAVSLISCRNARTELHDLMDEFEEACNELDFDEVIDLIDPKIGKKIKVATGIVGLFTNKTTDELFASLADWMVSDYDVGADFFESIDIEVERITISGDRANVYATLRVDVAGNDIEEEATFICVRRSGKWFISDFTVH